MPRGVAPSWKLTVPVGVAEFVAAGLTVAVKVTDWPAVDGLTEEARPVLVAAS
jgi:hypothetical protein